VGEEGKRPNGKRLLASRGYEGTREREREREREEREKKRERVRKE